MSTALDEEKLESILYETSNVILYKIPPPNIIKIGNHVQEYHDINRWETTKDNIIFKGILRIKEQEYFISDDSDYDSDEEDDSIKSLEEESAERFRLIIELINFQDQQVWATIRYYNLSPYITTIDNKSFHSIQLVNNSNLFSTFIEIDEDFKIGCGLKFPNRIESSNFQMILNNYLKDSENYTKMIKNNRQNKIRNDQHELNNDDNEISTQLQNSRLNDNINDDRNYSDSQVNVRKIESTSEEDTDDDDFGDYVG